MHQTCLQLTCVKLMQSCCHSTAHCCEPTCSNLLCEASAGLMGANATHYLDVPMALSIFKHHFFYRIRRQEKPEVICSPKALQIRHRLCYPEHSYEMPYLEPRLRPGTNNAIPKHSHCHVCLPHPYLGTTGCCMALQTIAQAFGGSKHEVQTLAHCLGIRQ